ncbi:hypothetical protein GCM10009799_44490 [Nocardiopsis rhodophaea]|uniref:Uncharacterized protein n=1 Tax=Nocardiopsis rhodophaea TaxID=280238 RepID=A0ABN2TJ75_9ACTN
MPSYFSPSSSPLQPLHALAKELEARRLGATIDASVSVVDAYVLPGSSRWQQGLRRACAHCTQRAILRPDPVDAHPWWWVLWPGERFDNETADPEVTRLLPVEEIGETARRIRNILILDSTE